MARDGLQNDFKNLLDNTSVGTIFLDRNLSIKRRIIGKTGQTKLILLAMVDITGPSRSKKPV